MSNFYNKSLKKKKMFLDSATILINPVVEAGKITDAGVIVGALEGSQTFEIEREYRHIEMARKSKNVKGLVRLQSEVARISFTAKGWEAELIKQAIQGKITNLDGVNKIESKGTIEDEDYIDNLVLVGEFFDPDTNTSQDGFVLIKNALNVNGFSSEFADNAEATYELVFEAFADFEEAGLAKAPYEIYLPNGIVIPEE